MTFTARHRFELRINGEPEAYFSNLVAAAQTARERSGRAGYIYVIDRKGGALYDRAALLSAADTGLGQYVGDEAERVGRMG